MKLDKVINKTHTVLYRGTNMAYMKKVTKTADGRIIVLEKYYSWKVRPTSCVLKEKRAARRKESPEAMKENNRRILIEAAALKIANNFREGDYYVTFTYDSASLPAADEKQDRVRKDIRNTLTKLKRRFEKAGLKFKYVAIPENLSPDTKGRAHFHILIPAMPALPTNKSRENFFSSIWGKGNVYCKEYGGTAEDAFRLASYFKKQKKEDRGARILMSHNMAKPVEKKQEIRFAECYSLDINVPAGYEVVREVSYQCYTQEGFPCQHVVLQKSASLAASLRRRYSVPRGQYTRPAQDSRRKRP